MSNRTPSYGYETSKPDGYAVHRVIRTRGGNVRTVAEYTDEAAAQNVMHALNQAAKYEDV
ncbi:hypothetical protein [Streptomyces sp. S1D4-14]|uniref:hypothetical protein n=1 Tax=Streptomyces sp. S1D4-14 TaxID=2594461 RepID=UPI001165A9E1|nr:hypothetical protein [Streptomyces sp. S1D4-14]QDN64470.1 hypothetical protein FNV66_01150 [Streptomyces sp. S1D4-14]